MSSSKIIPKEELSAYQRWELSALNEAMQRRGQTVRPGEVTLPTAQELEQVHARAFQEGFDAGLAEGRAHAAAETARLQALLAGVEQVVQAFEQELAQEVLSLALEVAKQVVRQTVNANPDSVLAVIREAVAALPEISHPPRLVLHPTDAELVRSLIEAGKFPHGHWKIVESLQIERGGCRIETATGEIDATLESRWKHVIASLGRDDPWIEAEPPRKKPQ